MKKFIIYFISTLLVVLVLYFMYYYNDNKIKVSLDSCVDGDTAWFIINNKREKVRLLGIDAPEIEKDGVKAQDYGEDAFKFTCNKLKSADNIYIEYDANSKKRDKYNRVLAWVFVDNDNLNKLLVSKGYARVRYVYDDYKYINDLCIEQDMAYRKHYGIWKNDNSYRDNYCLKNKIIDS